MQWLLLTLDDLSHLAPKDWPIDVMILLMGAQHFIEAASSRGIVSQILRVGINTSMHNFLSLLHEKLVQVPYM